MSVRSVFTGFFGGLGIGAIVSPLLAEICINLTLSLPPYVGLVTGLVTSVVFFGIVSAVMLPALVIVPKAVAGIDTNMEVSMTGIFLACIVTAVLRVNTSIESMLVMAILLGTSCSALILVTSLVKKEEVIKV